MNHWTNNLELLSISYSNRRHISLEAENEHRKKHAHHPAKLQGILPTFLSVFCCCSSLVYSSVVECITGLFQRILCMRYLTSSTITVFSSRPHSVFIYQILFRYFSSDCNILCTRTLLVLSIFIDRASSIFI